MELKKIIFMSLLKTLMFACPLIYLAERCENF